MLVRLEWQILKPAQVQDVWKQVWDHQITIAALVISATEECRKPRRVRAISYPGGCSQTFQPTLGNDLKKPNLAVAIAERSASSSSESSGRSEDVESCCNVDVGDDNSPKSALRNFLTIVALSLHCVFEGLAIGKKSRRSRKKIKTLQKKIWRRFRQKNQDALDKKKKLILSFFLQDLKIIKTVFGFYLQVNNR